LNRVRRLAEDLVNRYPTLFGGDFNKNKQALSQVAVIRTRALRNQLAGAITKLIHERAPAVVEEEIETEPATIEERIQAERPSTDSGASSSSKVSHENKVESGTASASQRASEKGGTIQENAAVAR
jgi:ribosomal protein S17E